VFTHLTLPMLQPVIVVCVVIRAIDAFRTFDIVWTLTGGGPGRSTELFSLYAYVLAFLNLDLGRGSAAAIVGGLIILVVGVGLYRPGRPRDEELTMAMVRRPLLFGWCP
jgi:multiple sugar transport system permease protein